MAAKKFASAAQKFQPAAAPPPPVPDAPKKGREGKKIVAAYFPRAVWKSLDDLGHEKERTMQSLLGEAIDLLLDKHGKPMHGER